MNCFAALCLVALLGWQQFAQRGPAMMAQSQPGNQASSTGARTPDQVIGSIIATRVPTPAEQTADQALPPDAPTRNQVLTLLVQARQTMVAAMEDMKQIMQNSAEESFRK